MSPQQTKAKLLKVKDNLGSIRRLVSAAEMSTERLDKDEREALSELLREIEHRLVCVSDELCEEIA